MNHTFRTLAVVMALAVAGLLGVATRTHAQALSTGTIAGTVTDAAGKKLSGVQITVEDSGQSDVTNANGYFVITEVLPGVHTLTASLVGYETVQATNITVTQELTTTVDLRLEKREVRETGVTRVVAPLVRRNVTPTLYTVTSQEEQLVRSQPNNLYQYPGALISQPGIVPDADGYPTVRGSRITEVGYMLDGILIVEPASGGFATNLVTVGMDRMNVYTGGYRAELGSSIGGIINSVIKTGASIRGAAVEAGTGSWGYSNLMYEQGNVESNGFNWYVSGNFFRTRFEENRQLEELPASADVVVKLVQPFGNKNRVSFMYTGGFERYEFPVNDPFTGLPWGGDIRAEHNVYFDYDTNEFVSQRVAQDFQNQKHNIGSLTWTHQLSNSSSLTAQAYTWDRRIDDHEFSDWSGFDYKGRDKLYAGKLDYSTQISPTFQVRIGGESIKGDNYNTNVTNAAPAVQRRVRDTDTLDQNAYISTTWRPSDRITADIGVRYDSRKYEHPDALVEAIAMGRATTRAADEAILAKIGQNPKYSEVTPRMGLTFTLSPKTILKASAGRFVQFAPSNYAGRYYIPVDDPTGSTPQVDQEIWLRNNRKIFDVGPEKVDSIDVGIETQLTDRIGLAVTPYWRKTKDMYDFGPVIQADGTPLPGGSAYGNWAEGETNGVEAKLQLRERGGLSGWVTYTYQRGRASTTGSIPGLGLVDPTRPDSLHRLDYDQEHTIYVVGQYRRRNFEINPMLELGSGYAFGAGEQYYPDPNDPDGERLLPILVDGAVASSDINSYNTGWHDNLSVTFRLYSDRERSSYYFLQVQNILNSEDVTAKNWFDPGTGSTDFGFVDEPVTYTDETGATKTAPGYFEYKTTTRVPPIFVLLGVRKTF